MSDEWSAQNARRVRKDEVLAMHVPDFDIHRLLRFPVHAFTSFSLPQVPKKRVFVFASCFLVKNRVV